MIIISMCDTHTHILITTCMCDHTGLGSAAKDMSGHLVRRAVSTCGALVRASRETLTPGGRGASGWAMRHGRQMSSSEAQSDARQRVFEVLEQEGGGRRKNRLGTRRCSPPNAA